MKTIIFDFYNTLYNPLTGRLFRGTLTLLAKLKRKYRLILITTGSSERWTELDSLGLFSYFSQIILCKQKEILLYKSFTSPDSLVIGDRPEEEIFIGKQLKISTILVNPNLENPIISLSKYLNI